MRVLITGASSGIGAETAILAAQRGFRIGLVARRTSMLEDVAERCRLAGATQVEFCTLDLTTTDVEGPLRDLAEHLGKGRLALVNNAGTAEFGDSQEMGFEHVERMALVNYLSKVKVTLALLPHLLASDPGVILNVCSIAAREAFSQAAGYCGSQAATQHYFRCLHNEYRAKLRITNLILGATETPLWEKVGWKPDSEKMLGAPQVAKAILGILESPSNQSIESVTLVPTMGVL